MIVKSQSPDSWPGETDQVPSKFFVMKSYLPNCQHFSGVLGYICWYEGIGRMGVTKSLVYLYFIPICPVLFNTFLMGEKIFLQQIIGGALIL
jgi:hypothetical protein